jgi:hypothetical protein
MGFILLYILADRFFIFFSTGFFFFFFFFFFFCSSRVSLMFLVCGLFLLVGVVRVSKYDGNAVKQALDDVVAKVLLEAYTEDTWISNGKLAMGAVCVVLGLVSQFYPLPFPSNLPLLKVCVAAYCILSALGWALAYWKEGDVIFRSKPSDFRPRALSVASSMARYSAEYKLSMQGSGGGKPLNSTTTIDQWIDESGALLQDKFVTHVRDLLRAFESQPQ